MTINNTDTQYRKELEALAQYTRTPGDLDFIQKQVEAGVFSIQSRGRMARKLYEMVTLAKTNAIYFDYKRGEWLSAPNVKLGEYNVDVTSTTAKWRQHLRFKKFDTPQRYRSSGGGTATVTRDEAQVNVLYGMELEMYPKGGLQSSHGGDKWEMLTVWGNGMPDCGGLKSDGSLNSGGMEFVSSPAPFDVIRQSLMNLKNSGVMKKFKTDDRCGIHVHISREPLNEIRAATMLFFINSPLNNSFIKDIGGRSQGSHSYCSFACDVLKKYNITKPYQLITNRDAEFRSSMSSHVRQHYAAMSWSTRHPTYEFRIFNGTVDPNTLLLYVEFVAALVDFSCNGATRSDASWELFCRWLSDPHKTGDLEKDRVPLKPVDKHPCYPVLYAHLKSLGRIDQAWKKLMVTNNNTNVSKESA